MNYNPILPHPTSHVKPDLETKKKAKENTKDIYENGFRLKALERRVDHLLVLNESLWEILKQQTSLDDQALTQKIQETKRLVAERKKAKIICPACHQKIPADKTKCYYCGEELGTALPEQPFDIS